MVLTMSLMSTTGEVGGAAAQAAALASLACRSRSRRAFDFAAYVSQGPTARIVRCDGDALDDVKGMMTILCSDPWMVVDLCNDQGHGGG